MLVIHSFIVACCSDDNYSTKLYILIQLMTYENILHYRVGLNTSVSVEAIGRQLQVQLQYGLLPLTSSAAAHIHYFPTMTYQGANCCEHINLHTCLPLVSFPWLDLPRLLGSSVCHDGQVV